MSEIQPGTTRAVLDRRQLLRAGLAAGTGLIGAAIVPQPASAGTAATAHSARHNARDFVRARGRHFWVGPDRYSVAGTNNYYLHYKSHAMIDDVLDDAKAMGLNSIRTWGWIDGPPSDGVSLQPEPGVYPEEAYERFDYAVAGAKRRGLRLVVPFTNNWSDFGGIPQYAAWFDAEHDDFFRRDDNKDAYKDYVRNFLNRRNRYTGIRYRSEPTVMTWELANEPRCPSDKSGDTLTAWADEMSRFVKRHAPHHLVAVGDEGFFGRTDATDYPYTNYEGVVWPRLVSLPAVDYGTVHLYPDSWGVAGDKGEWGARWIADHIRVGHRLGKPVVIEEFGLRDPSQDEQTRNDVYRLWTDIVLRRDGDGDQFWILTGAQDDGTLYPDYDGFRVTYPSSTAALLSEHARDLRRRDHSYRL